TGRARASTPLSDPIAAMHPLADGDFVVLSAGSGAVTRFGLATRSPVWTQRLTASRFLFAQEIVATGRGDLVVTGAERGIPRFAVPLNGVPPPKSPHGAFFLRLDSGAGVLLGGRWLDWNGMRRVTSMAMQG